jgi:hypothetical protein
MELKPLYVSTHCVASVRLNRSYMGSDKKGKKREDATNFL